MQQNQERGSHGRKTIGDVAMGLGLGIFDSVIVYANIQLIEAHNTGPVHLTVLAVGDSLCLLATYWYGKSLIPKKTDEQRGEQTQHRQRRSHEAFRRMPRDPHRNSRQRGR